MENFSRGGETRDIQAQRGAIVRVVLLDWPLPWCLSCWSVQAEPKGQGLMFCMTSILDLT
jgi:hypothetical protein